MKSLLILPLLIIKALSISVNDHGDLLSMRDDNQVMPKLCFVDTSQYKMLNPNSIRSKLTRMAIDAYSKLKAAGIDINADQIFEQLAPNKLDIAVKNARYLHIEYDTNKLCGLKVFKNATSGDFIVEYNSFSKTECTANSTNNIICNNSENNKCDMAIKCCDSITMCEKINSFLLKSVATIGSQPIKNSNSDICTYNRNSDASCFTLALFEEENNSQMQSGGQLNFLLRMLYITILPYMFLK